MTAQPLRQASLLRGVNVGGNALVAMARLRAVYEGLGAEDVATLLQSGNVVFRHSSPTAEVSRLAEKAIAAEFGLKIVVIGRTHAQLERILAVKHFEDAEPNRRFVVFLSAAPEPGSERALDAFTGANEELLLVGSELHMHLRDGAGRSRLQLPVIERKLGVIGTARNWNTVTKLAALTGEASR